MIQVNIKNVLTATSGYLEDIASHSLNPYSGCAFGRSLCGVACYVQHNGWITKGREWGSFLEARTNAAESYIQNAPCSRRLCHKQGKKFAIFMASSTDPFPPQERKTGVSKAILEAMLREPPDELVLQTHSADVADHVELLCELNERVDRLRIQISIETDRDRLGDLPPPAFSPERRMKALQRVKEAGLEAVCCVSPLLPIEHPERFFEAISVAASAVIVDHFIGGDGSAGGARTMATRLPAVMVAIEPGSSKIEYQDKIVGIARQVMPGRVGVGRSGFAGRFA